MAYRVVQPTQLRQEPTDTGEPVRALLSKAVLTFLGKKQGDGDDVWINVEFKPPGGSTSVKGWVRLKHCEEIADAPREEVNPEGFVRTCLTAERSFNDLGSTAPWFVSADFVIARAVIETGLTNAGPKASETDAVGPLQVASPEWAMFLDNAGPFAADFEPGGRDHPTLQVYGATYRMHVDMKAISQAKLDKGIGTREDPFLPSNLDIFHAYLTNSPAAAVAILDARDSDADKNKKIDEILKGVLTDEQITALFKARSQFTGEKGNPKSVSEFVAATESALSDALKKAFDLIKELCPEELPAAKQAEAPWFDFAQTQEGIKEPDPRILDYFDATDFKPKPRSTTTPWCGAFASYCMMKSGDATAAASIPGGSAAAVNWKKWGASLTVKPEEVPLGAVVVLSPSPGTGGTGHVGFYAQFLNDGKTVELLGGNQSNQVVRKAFPASRIVAIRWLDLGPPTAAEAAAQVPLPAGEPPPGAPPPVGGHPGGPAPAMAISPAARDLIVEAEVSSKAAYDRRYCRPEWPQGASGVTIGIGYDCGYATRDGLRRDWEALPGSMVDALAGAVGVKGGSAGPLAKQLRDRVNVPWEHAMSVFDSRDVPRWVEIVRRALPNTDALSPDCLGALVSLAYNRGASFSKAGGRYDEMRAIKAHMASKEFAKIPEQFRRMKRLWPSMRGLQIRREREAQLFEQGLRP